ncbi:MAG: hypothetical protein R3F20_00325 [Planctomycetota bacterium]
MDHLGHGLALDHAIFRRPFPATFEWTELPRQKEHEGFTSPLHPRGVGETLRLAAFETGKPEVPNPTLVAHEGFFTDVPGFENLAEGHSAKVLGSLSLARQGRYFYWGYAIDPARMTAGAKDTLCNVLHYMIGFRGEETVPFVCKTRESLRTFTWLGRETGYRRGLEEHIPGSLTPKWRETWVPTWEGLDAWMAKHLPYVFSGKGPEHAGERYKTIYEVDEDAMALGTPNGARASLERWMALAGGEGEDAARARRCLARYVLPEIAPADGKWDVWYARYRDRIVFVESAGFWWREDPRILERERRASAAGAPTSPR